MQKIKFVTGFGGFGGSTVALIEHCKLLNDNGYDAWIYSFDDWALSKYEKSRKVSELKIDKDDILIYHLIEQNKRPNCKRCYLYVHEKGIWDLRFRATSGFDQILFVSESQMRWHGVKGVVVPNPVTRMVDKALHRPPNQDIVGIIGTIQPRKRQHLSIQQALLDGKKKILLFGDKEKDEQYFEEQIKPLLSDVVIYRGFLEPERRMDMYNEFDTLYINSYDESASLVLGECKILGKNVIKDDSVEDYEVVDDKSVLSKWKELFEAGSFKIDEKNAVFSPGECEKLVCVVTHDRKELVSKWLRAWNNANKFGAKIAVLHAFDGESPSKDEMDNILQWRPDYYIPFKNTDLRDMQALLLVIKNQAGLPDWKYLFWFTDDCMPMNKNFLQSFDSKIKLPNVGLVSLCYEPNRGGDDGGCVLPHIRTVGYALRRESADKLAFPNVGKESERPHLFEHGRKGFYENHILNQILKAGFTFKTAYSDTNVPKEVDPASGYVHWTESLDSMWDCHLLSNGFFFKGRPRSGQDLWDIYEQQFVPDDRKSISTFFSAKECDKMSLIPKKICAIIPTYSSPMNYFMWSVFSLIIRSDPRELEHIIIAINGPDSRYPSANGCQLQDRKQCFIEDLRNIPKWDRPGVFNPGAVTLMRTWSRVGHPPTIDQCISWVHTQHYLVMHDDIIVIDKNWSKSVYDFSLDPKLVAKTLGDPLVVKLQRHGNLLEFPHLSTTFSLFDKPLMRMINAFWMGYYINKKNFKIKDHFDFKDFIEVQNKFGCVANHESEDWKVKDDIEFEGVSMEIGTFAYYAMMEHGLKMTQFPTATVKHFYSGTWKNFKQAYEIHPEVEDLEKEIMKIPEYAEIYERYKENDPIV
jgi:hypothetical protein